MDIFILKLLLTPLFIAALTLIGRRWGPAVSGAVAGLPLTSGPVSVFLALEQGTQFAARAAIATLAGLVAVGAFCVGYAFSASRKNWIVSTITGAAAFFASASLLFIAPLGLVANFLIVACFLALFLKVMPQPTKDASVLPLARPKWDLLLRIGIATGLVFLLTAVAPKLGPQATGLVSPFPIFGGVLAIFAHRHSGVRDAQRVLRSIVLASFSFAVFFLIVGAMLARYDIGTSYVIAAIVSLAVNVALFKSARANPRPS